jgi:hypothetical protein
VSTTNIWGAAVADAVGKAQQSNVSPSANIWQAATADALGQRAPVTPTPPTPSEQAFSPMKNNQPSAAAMGGYFLPRYESPAEARGGAAQVGLGLATAGAASGIGALASPTAQTTQVGTGILDATGQEIMKDISTMGPSALRQAANAVSAASAAHPVVSNLIKIGLVTLGLKHAGALKALFGAAGGAE